MQLLLPPPQKKKRKKKYKEEDEEEEEKGLTIMLDCLVTAWQVCLHFGQWTVQCKNIIYNIINASSHADLHIIYNLDSGYAVKLQC